MDGIRPECKLIGKNGNIFNLIAIASHTLKEHGMAAEAEEMRNRIYACGSYVEALDIISEYVEIV